MNDQKRPTRFVFPPWANYLLPVAILAALGAGPYVPLLIGLGASPLTQNVGYAPEQPVHYSHALHVGQLGMDCRYCHNTVEESSFAAIPPTQTCMNCHHSIRKDDAALSLVRESYETGKPIEWVKVHDLADYAYFNHAAHVAKGVGCESCHGRVDQMEVVYQAEPLSMGWCIECHREPEKHLRPRDQVTTMGWDPQEALGKSQLELGLELKKQYNIHDQNYMVSCSLCHR